MIVLLLCECFFLSMLIHIVVKMASITNSIFPKSSFVVPFPVSLTDPMNLMVVDVAVLIACFRVLGTCTYVLALILTLYPGLEA